MKRKQKLGVFAVNVSFNEFAFLGALQTTMGIQLLIKD